MKNLIILFFFGIILFSSCDPTAEEKLAMERCLQEEILLEESIRENLQNTFDAPFPKRNRNLAKILGDTLLIRGKCGGWDIKTYNIKSNKKSNTITDVNTGQVIFKGTVCKFRDLYYCSEKLNDTSYRIFALKITDSLIYGLQNYFQYMQTDTTIVKGGYPKLVKYIDKNKKIIRLQPDKRELKKLFTSIIAKTEPLEIINSNKVSNASAKNDEDETATLLEPDEFETISKVYPNPATNILNVDLYQNNVEIPYYLTDLTGKIVMQGQLQVTENKLDIGQLASGIYSLTIVTKEKQKESVKIIKK